MEILSLIFVGPASAESGWGEYGCGSIKESGCAEERFFQYDMCREYCGGLGVRAAKMEHLMVKPLSVFNLCKVRGIEFGVPKWMNLARSAAGG